MSVARSYVAYPESPSVPSVLQIAWQLNSIKETYCSCHWMVRSHVSATDWIIYPKPFPLSWGLWMLPWRSRAIFLSHRLCSWPCDLLARWDMSARDMRKAFKCAPMGCVGSCPFGRGTRRASSKHLRSLGWRHVDLNLTWNLTQRCATSPHKWGKYRLAFYNPLGFQDYLLWGSAGLYVLLWTICPRLDRMKQVSGLSP